MDFDVKQLLDFGLAQLQAGHRLPFVIALAVLLVGAVRWAASKFSWLAFVNTKWGGWGVNIAMSVGLSTLDLIVANTFNAVSFLGMATSAIVASLGAAGLWELKSDALPVKQDK